VTESLKILGKLNTASVVGEGNTIFVTMLATRNKLKINNKKEKRNKKSPRKA